MFNNSNSLHHPVGPAYQSTYSTLIFAMPGPTPEGRLPIIFRLPQPIYTTSPKYTSPHGLSAPIIFDIKGNVGQGAGIAMRDLCARSVPGLQAVMQCGDERVINMVPGGKMTFRIMWPGYMHLPSSYPIDITADPSMTRARLGQIIGQAFMRFTEAYRHTKSTQPLYSIAGTGIRLEHICLLSIQNTCDDSWQADIVIDLR